MVSDVGRMPGPVREQPQLGGHVRAFPSEICSEIDGFKSCHLLTWKNRLTLRQKLIRA